LFLEVKQVKFIGPTEKEVTGWWKNTHDEDLHDFASPCIKEDEMGGACSMHGREQECLQGFGVEI